MKKEKLILAIVSLTMIVGSVLGLSFLIKNIQGHTVVENVVTEKKEKNEEGITEKPFQVLVSGMDNFAYQKRKGRSDLNLLLTVNPVSKTILITNIPRDTYVKVPDLSPGDYDGFREEEIRELELYEATKLSHLSYWGPIPLVKGVEELLDTKVDYFVQINMSGFSTLIDAVGGVDVEAAQSFKTDWGTSYKKGTNHVNGKDALTFVRERHHLNSYEVTCGNQIEMMRSVIDKLSSESVLEMDTDALYQLLKENVRTNMSAGEILSLIRMQIDDRAEWKIESATLKGTSQFKIMSDTADIRLYTLVPKKGSLEKIHERIQSICQLKE